MNCSIKHNAITYCRDFTRENELSITLRFIEYAILVVDHKIIIYGERTVLRENI